MPVVSSFSREPSIGPGRRSAMATHVDEFIETEDLLPPIQVLDGDEWRAFFEDKVQTLLGISAEEFERRYLAGEYDEIWDDPDHSDIGYLAMLGGVGR
jgi:hypothetical protein